MFCVPKNAYALAKSTTIFGSRKLKWAVYITIFDQIRYQKLKPAVISWEM